jgi:hypothetical protein
VYNNTVAIRWSCDFEMRVSTPDIDVSTTMVYTHVLNRGGGGVRSPLDGRSLGYYVLLGKNLHLSRYLGETCRIAVEAAGERVALIGGLL